MKSRKLIRSGLVAIPLLLVIALIPVMKKMFSTPAKTTPLAKADSLPKGPPADSTDFRQNDNSKKIFAAFYQRLAAAQKEGKLVRILHYGDSQIEADRVTGSFRTKLQENFGGCGIGWLPVTEVSIARSNVNRSTSGTWFREELKLKNKATRMGFGGIVNTYPDRVAGVKLKVNKNAPALEQQADQLSVFYRSGNSSSNISLRDASSSIGQKALSGTNFSEETFSLPQRSWSALNLEFTGGNGPEIYGLSLDGKAGVAVDNISMRGSSATEFLSMDTLFYREQMKALDPGMIVLEFGLNVVPNVVSDYSYYEKELTRQLSMIRRAAPNAAILVVGVSEASRRKKGVYEPYPNLEKISAAQRAAAEKTGCAFWDLRAVMGGKGSMEDWSKKKLAEKDHMHFSNDGAALVGGKLFDALMRDYTRQTGLAAPVTTVPNGKQTASK